MTQLPARALSAGLALVLWQTLACHRASPAPPPPPTTSEGRFPHELHLDGRKLDSTACASCHDPRAMTAGQAARPGSTDHAPCDQDQCHRDAFLTTPGTLCVICHRRVEPTVSAGSPLRPYPPVEGSKSLTSRFSHARHLNFGKMEKAVGFHVSCIDCHVAVNDGRFEPVGHGTCARCHAAEAAPKDLITLRNCVGCHDRLDSVPRQDRVLIVGDLHFEHRRHQADIRGKAIGCAECHRETRTVENIATHSPPPTASCVVCHDDTKRVPRTARMRTCETCHRTKEASFRSLAPRSHLPVSELPVDHTIAFRSAHEREAELDPERCATCHQFLSGSKRQICDQCHSVMKPQSHAVTWREYDHGPAAGTNTDSCSTCHGADFCIACHARPPRSHFPLADFRLGHGGLAQFNVRACTTCHFPDNDCTTSGCHTATPP